jgi:hypothetical protein
MEMRLIKLLSRIIKDAESIHMHFPLQILAENTYLTSYFNDKIKNNKWNYGYKINIINSKGNDSFHIIVISI